jgi:hypothetical protein
MLGDRLIAWRAHIGYERLIRFYEAFGGPLDLWMLLTLYWSLTLLIDFEYEEPQFSEKHLFFFLTIFFSPYKIQLFSIWSLQKCYSILVLISH